jgi:hypothetical protein
MRPVLVADVLALARVLSVVPGGLRPDLANSLISQSEAADQYRVQSGRSHPCWGDGSVTARCLLACPASEPGPDDPAFLEAIATAAGALATRMRRCGNRRALV